MSHQIHSHSTQSVNYKHQIDEIRNQQLKKKTLAYWKKKGGNPIIYTQILKDLRHNQKRVSTQWVVWINKSQNQDFIKWKKRGTRKKLTRIWRGADDLRRNIKKKVFAALLRMKNSRLTGEDFGVTKAGGQRIEKNSES